MHFFRNSTFNAAVKHYKDHFILTIIVYFRAERMARDEARFHWADYLTFSLSMLLSIAVGIYCGFIKKQDKNVDSYFLGNRNMPVLPVAISMFLSWFSSIAFLADPVEVYFYGAIYWIVGLGYVLGLVPIVLYFAPRFYRINFLSINEVRFSQNY